MNTLKNPAEDLINELIEKHDSAASKILASGGCVTKKMYLATPCYIEHCILESMQKGETKFLDKKLLKPKDKYFDESRSPFRGFQCWTECFSENTEVQREYPIECVKVRLRNNSFTDFYNAGDSLLGGNDRKIGLRMRNFAMKNHVPLVLMVPIGIVLPQVLVKMTNHARRVMKLLSYFYSLQHSGFFLFSEHMTKEEAKKHLIFDIDL